jgi:hypothetical protein
MSRLVLFTPLHWLLLSIPLLHGLRMVRESRQEQHDRLLAKSYKILAKAQEDAA